LALVAQVLLGDEIKPVEIILSFLLSPQQAAVKEARAILVTLLLLVDQVAVTVVGVTHLEQAQTALLIKAIKAETLALKVVAAVAAQMLLGATALTVTVA
jgi:hypothetical protein